MKLSLTQLVLIVLASAFLGQCRNRDEGESAAKDTNPKVKDECLAKDESCDKYGSGTPCCSGLECEENIPSHPESAVCTETSTPPPKKECLQEGSSCNRFADDPNCCPGLECIDGIPSHPETAECSKP